MGCNSSLAAVCPVAAADDAGAGSTSPGGAKAKKVATAPDSAASRCTKCQTKSPEGVDEDGRDLPSVKRPRGVREVPDGEDDEVVDIDLEDPEVEQAATKIQAAFRGHRVRKQQEEAVSEASMQPGDEEPSKEQLMAEFNPEDKELCHAATKIQASFRGHQARKQVTKTTDDELSKSIGKLDTSEAEAKAKLDEELADIDLTDPELHKAATKIQASFRGHKVRKEGPDDN